MASRLIALDKCPGVHPIGIGEALWWILCKFVALASRGNLEDVCGVAQLCSGSVVYWLACWYTHMEEAIHAVRELFDLHTGSAVS